ncbi:MAG: hypothetical protein ABIT01_02125, partial [Thermoanaerobaculia bacterium]
MPCEFREVVESLVEKAVHRGRVHVEISVHQHVTETGHRPEARGERSREDPQLREAADGRAVIRDVPPRRGCEVRRDVQGVLGAELETALDDPELLLFARRLVSNGVGRAGGSCGARSRRVDRC